MNAQIGGKLLEDYMKVNGFKKVSRTRRQPLPKPILAWALVNKTQPAIHLGYLRYWRWKLPKTYLRWQRVRIVPVKGGGK